MAASLIGVRCEPVARGVPFPTSASLPSCSRRDGRRRATASIVFVWKRDLMRELPGPRCGGRPSSDVWNRRHRPRGPQSDRPGSAAPHARRDHLPRAGRRRASTSRRASGSAHRRLSIVDLTSGGPPAHGQRRRQPPGSSSTVRSTTTSSWPRSCGAAAPRFRSDSDTEVLLAALRARGAPACLTQAERHVLVRHLGRAASRELFAARDRLGIKPFYYCRARRPAGCSRPR